MDAPRHLDYQSREVDPTRRREYWFRIRMSILLGIFFAILLAGLLAPALNHIER